MPTNKLLLQRLKNQTASTYVGRPGEVTIDVQGDKLLKIHNGTTPGGVNLSVSAVATPATTTNLGSIKVGANLTITEDGTLNAENGDQAADRLVNGDLELVLGSNGSLTTPLLLPKTFTAVLDELHFNSGPGLPLTGDPWEYVIQFQVGMDGTVQTMIGNVPWPSNPGYSDNMYFTFTEQDHGIPNYIFILTLTDVQNPGPMMYTANISVSQPPEYPSTVKSLGAVKLTADTNSWTLGTNGVLTLPQYNFIESVGSNATISLNGVASNESIIELATTVDGEMITSVFAMNPAYGIQLTSVRTVDIHAGYDSATFKYDAWQAAEALWVEVRNADAQLIAPGTRTWAGMPSYQAYPLLMDFIQNIPGGEIPPSSNMAPAALTAKTAYELWQTEQAAINVTITAKDQTWTFGNNGQLTVPGAIRKDGGLYLNSGGDGISSTVLVNGTAGSVVLRTDNGITNKSLTLDVDGETTLPGRLNFADGSSYNDHRLSGDMDSDLAFEVFRIPTVSAEAIAGSSQDLLVVDISTDDDITVVGVGWEINSGSVLAPIWLPVVSTDIVPGEICSIDVPGFEFIAGFTYTFRNTVPEAHVWTIRSQTGGLLGPGGVIITNENYPAGAGTYRELAIELPTPDSQNEQRWVFDNSGNLQLPVGGDIVDSNGNTVLGGVGSSFTSLVNGSNTVSLDTNGNLQYPGGITQSRQDDTFCSAGVDTVVYTSTAQYRHAIKLFVMVEGMAPGGDGVNWDTQACDVIAVRGYANDIVHVTTYGVTYSSAAAFATFDGQWNATTNRIEITCRPVSPTNGVAVSVHAIEMNSND